MSARLQREWIKVGERVATLRTGTNILMAKVETIIPRNNLYLEAVDLNQAVSNLELHLRDANPLVLCEIRRTLLDLFVRLVTLTNQLRN